MFSNIRLKARLYTSLFFLLVFVLLAVWFVFTQVENIVNEEVPKQEAVLEMEINILEAASEIYQDVLLASGAGTAQWEKNLRDFQAARNELDTMELSAEEERIVERLDDLAGETVEVGEELIANNQEIGQGDSGLIGEFREDIHAVEDAVASEPDLLVQVLEIRRDEKDFLLRKDEQYAGQVEENVESLQEQVDTETAERLASYLQTFERVVELTEEQKRQRTEFRDQLIRLNNILDDELQEISADNVARGSLWATYSFIAIVLVLLASVFVLYYTVRSIMRRIDYYREVTNAITEGDVKDRIQIKNNDELADLAEDFNEMTDSILSEQIFTETLIESMGDGAIVIDPLMEIALFNPVAEEVTGYSEDEVIGKRFDEVLKLVHDGTDRRNDTFIKRAMIEGEVQYMEGDTSLITKEGKQVAVDDSAAPIRDGDGNIQGVVIIFRDVTEQRQLEREKNMFFNIASHQLRTPLGSMRWNLESLLEGDEGEVPEQMRPVLEDVKNANQRLVKLVNNLLDISRIEQGRQVDKAEVVELQELIHEVEAEMRPVAKEGGIKLQVIVDDDIPEIEVYRRELRDVIENLLSNALKYTDEDGEVTLEAMFSGNNVKIQVSDTGIGIPDQDQEQIFDRFYRATNATGRNVQGTGIGLSVSKMFVEKLGGRLWFESEEGVGTVFHVVLPFDEIAPNA